MLDCILIAIVVALLIWAATKGRNRYNPEDYEPRDIYYD